MNRTSARSWDLLSAALLTLVVLTASQRLYSTNWTGGLGTAFILSFIGILLGMALGFSKFKPKAVIGLTFGYSVTMVILVLGGILYRRISWVERLFDLSDRLAYALDLFFKKQQVHDPILFIIFIALVFWIIGLLAGYALTRHGNFIGAIAPAGVALLIIQLYDAGKGSNNTFLAVYFFLSLLFLGRLTYVKRRLYWKEHRLSLLAESKTDMHVTLALVALAAVLLVWLAPTSLESFTNAKAAWENLTRPLRDVQKDLGHAVAGLQGGAKVTTIQFYGDALPLGSEAAKGDITYLRIQAPVLSGRDRYYWRVRSYNIYLNNQWYAQNVSRSPFSPDQAPILLADPKGGASNFTFTVVSVNLSELVTPARPVWVSYPSELLFVKSPEGKMDPIQFQPNSAIPAGQKYSVRANIYKPVVTQLRSAGETYPDWVTQYYLQLPNDLSPEILALARQITKDAKTPYDMAAAITQYLRDNITYAVTVKNPPPRRDPLDWFLFDSKSGFCNYYATAEVILLRAVGIPARMAVGFAQGEFSEPNTYVVRQRDAHAWPEVYFPGVGWVEFEPTVSQAPLERPLDATPSGVGEEDENHGEDLKHNTGQIYPVPIEENKSGPGWMRPANWLLRLAFLYGISVTIFWIYFSGALDGLLKAGQRISQRPLPVLLMLFYEKRGLVPPGWLQRWAYMTGLNPIERAFKTVFRSLKWLGQKPAPAQTPAEAAHALSALLPNVSSEIYSLSDEYQHNFYGHKFGYLPLARRTEKVIRREALRVAVQQRWRALRNIFSPGHLRS